MPEAATSARAGRRRSSRWPMLVLVGALVFLYLPIAVVVVMAFNESGSAFRWSGFSTHWFGELAGNEAIIGALGNTLLVAAGATALSVVLGTLLAIGLVRYTRSAWDSSTEYSPRVMPRVMYSASSPMAITMSGATAGPRARVSSHAERV